MTTSHHDHINELISNQFFNEVKSSFRKSDLTSVDLIQIYKRQNRKKPRLFDQVEFWQSELPLLYLNELMVSELKSNFLHKYFSKNEHANDQLNLCLFLNFEDGFLRYYKLNSSFLLSSFRASLSRISLDVPELRELTIVSQFLHEASDLLDKRQAEDNNLLLQLDFNELFMGLALYYQHIKYNPKMIGKKSEQFKKENALLDLVQHVISLKKNSEFDFNFSPNNKLQEEFMRYQDPHPILGKEGLSLPLDKVYKLVFEIADHFIEFTKQKNLIELYQCGYADTGPIVSKRIDLQPNEEFKRFHRNDYKKEVEEFYFLETTLEKLVNDPLKRISIKSDLKMFDFYGIPTDVDINKDKVDLEKVLSLLKRFSVFKGPPERTIFEDKTFIINNKADTSFRTLFGTNESLSSFNHAQLKEGIAEYFGWPEMEVDFLLRFLTFDLIEGELPHHWIQRPFLKINDQIIWLGTFLKDRRWSNITLNKLKKELSRKDPSSREYLEEIATNLEIKVENVFKSAGFKTVQGLEYKFERKIIGELDVVAFKDNHLFICEVKSGERSHDFSYAAHRELVKLDEGAVHQLKRAIDNKDLYFKQLQAKLGREIGQKIVKIIPMIVTDTFEGDQYFTEKEIRKVSLLEIDVILKNKKKELFEAYQFYESFANSKGSESKTQADWNLWNSSESLSCDRFLEIIDNNEVWSEFK